MLFQVTGPGVAATSSRSVGALCRGDGRCLANSCRYSAPNDGKPREEVRTNLFNGRGDGHKNVRGPGLQCLSFLCPRLDIPVAEFFVIQLNGTGA
jgi:hypothetical protein